MKVQSDYQAVNMKNIIHTFKYWPCIFRLLWKSDSKRLIAIIFLTVLSGVMPMITLIASQNLINAVVLHMNQKFDYILRAFLFLVVVSLFSEVIQAVRGHHEMLFRNILQHQINVSIMDKAIHLQLEDFENAEVYDKLQRAQNEANYRPYQVFSSILGVLGGVVTFLSSAVILLSWRWWVVCILLFIPLISSIYFVKIGQHEFWIQWVRAPRYRKSWYLNFLLTRDTAFKEIKLFHLGNYLLEKYKKINREFIQEDKLLLKRRTIITLVFQTLNQFAGDIIVLMILWSAFRGEILVGSVVAYIRAVSLTQSHSQGILSSIFSIYQNNLYIKQLFEFLDLPLRKPLDVETEKRLGNIHTIEFRNVSFRYPGTEDYALKNVSFAIHKNETIALVGKNGSGKTTLVKLLTKLYPLDEGDIFINGIPINELSTYELRERIGVIFQDFVRYELTMKENIGFGNLKYLDINEKLMASAELTGLSDIIEKMPKKLDTQLGKWFEEGYQLSGGQWQKIALARAFVRDADVYILDEPSAALDPLAESEMFQKFFELTNQKIGLFISHRFCTVKHAKKIIVLDKGQIVESGTHEELIKANGLYASLYNVQAQLWKEIDFSLPCYRQEA